MLAVMRGLSSRQSRGSSHHSGDNCVPLGSLPNGLPNMGLPHGLVLRRSNSAPILRCGEQCGGEQLLGMERPSNLRGQSTAGTARRPPPLSRTELSISRTELTISRRGSRSSNHSSSGGEGARVGSPLAAARAGTMGSMPSPSLRRGSKSPSNPRSPPFSRRGSRDPSQYSKGPCNNPRNSPPRSASPPSHPAPLPLGMAALPPLSSPPLQGLASTPQVG
jgi:hypothetical protein